MTGIVQGRRAAAIDARRVRDADESEVGALARLWYHGWQDAHAEILPASLARFRTVESFAERLSKLLPAVRVVGPPGNPLAFCITKGDELYQLFVAERARGSGIAAALVADAEALLAERGVERAWLTCAIGNDRAARFYEKQGWHRTGVIVSELETPEGIMRLEVWRYEKELRAPRLGDVHGGTMRIRRSTDADFPAMLTIVNDAARAYRGVIPSDRWHEPYMPAEELKKEMAEGVIFWVAERDGRVEGVMGIQDKGEVALVRHAYVATTTQRSRVGTRLLRHVEGLVDKPILIGTWAAASWAIRFYERNGFRLVSSRDKDRLLRTYWSIPDRQIETSVVLANERWAASEPREPTSSAE